MSIQMNKGILIVTSLFMFATACDPESGNTQVVNTDQVQGTLNAPSLVNGRLVQEGHFTATLPGRPARDFKVTLTNTLTRGDGDAVMEITDESDGSQTVLALDDEQAYGELETPDGDLLAATYNADETISVGDTVFDTPEAAAEQIFSSEDAADVSPESLAVASAMLDASDEGGDTATDRSAVKKAVKWVWKQIISHGITIIIKVPV